MFIIPCSNSNYIHIYIWVVITYCVLSMFVFCFILCLCEWDRSLLAVSAPAYAMKSCDTVLQPVSSALPVKDLGMESTSLDDVLYRYASFRNLVDPITHDLIISLAKYIHCPKTVINGTRTHTCTRLLTQTDKCEFSSFIIVSPDLSLFKSHLNVQTWLTEFHIGTP